MAFVGLPEFIAFISAGVDREALRPFSTWPTLPGIDGTGTFLFCESLGLEQTRLFQLFPFRIYCMGWKASSLNQRWQLLRYTLILICWAIKEESFNLKKVDHNRFRVMQALSKLEHAHIQFVRRTNHRRYFLVDLRVFFENARFAGLVQTAHLLFIQIW